MTGTPAWLRVLVDRYDPGVFHEPGRTLHIALTLPDGDTWEVALAGEEARIVPVTGRPDAVITARSRTWTMIAAEASGALSAYLTGRLSVRRNLHVGVGFLAATSGVAEPARMRFRYIPGR